MAVKLSWALAVLGLLCAAGAGANPWANMAQPSRTAVPESIGAYDGGCLAGGVRLPADGVGYQAMRLSRQRLYGHPELTRFIEDLGRQVAARRLGVLLVGDLGQARGGPTPSGHRSHQSGLDVDIWFWSAPQAATRPLTGQERETLGAPSMLRPASDALDNRHWSPRNRQILQLAAEAAAVERIFVNPSIKRELCRHHGGQPWLRKIRPWWHHDDHFHVRLACPHGSPDCQRQPPLPAGDGCGADLMWWFSDEAKKPGAKTAKPKPQVLPARCAQLLTP